MTMEPNNTEKQFREKLNSREIKPSENAWDRLAAMLTVADPSVSELAKQKQKSSYRWMYFAASFLGFILIATVFLNQTQDAIDLPIQKVVFEPNEVGNNKKGLDEILEATPKNTETVKVETSEKSTKNNDQKDVIQFSQKPTNVKSTPTAIAVNSNPTTNKSLTVIRELSSNEKINQKTEVKVNANSLLASVDNQISNQAVANNTEVVKVNANNLLSQVDDELELSFRERVIQSVNKKYREVKVAVIKRNLE